MCAAASQHHSRVGMELHTCALQADGQVLQGLQQSVGELQAQCTSTADRILTVVEGLNGRVAQVTAVHALITASALSCPPSQRLHICASMLCLQLYEQKVTVLKVQMPAIILSRIWRDPPLDTFNLYQ